MGIFSIETPVDKSEFDEAKRQEDDYKGKVEGFDQEPTVSDSEAEWDIDMSGAISSIAKDMETTSKRINNISVAITTVNENHDKLQESLSFTAPEVTGYTDSNSQSNSDSDNDCKNCNNQDGFDDFGAGFGSGVGGGSSSGSADWSGDPEEAQELFDALTEALPDLNAAAICGIMANMWRESRFVPTAYNANDNGGPSFGLCQWHNERYYNLMSYCGDPDYKTVEGQCKFLAHELSSSESATYAALKKIDDSAEGAGEAAQQFFTLFERGYGDAGSENAKKLYEQLATGEEMKGELV